MRVFADSSFLVPAIIEAHPHHERTFPWIQKVLRKEIVLGIASHSLAEVFSTLTTLPISPRIPPGTALQIISENLIEKVQVVEYAFKDYQKVLRIAAEKGLAGGVVYDILIGVGFEKFKAEALLTFNYKDFVRIFPEKKEVIVNP